MGMETFADRVAEWELLATDDVATQLGPAMLLRAIVQRTNAAIAETSSELAKIDAESRTADKKAADLRDNLANVADQITRWLRSGVTASIVDPNAINQEPFRREFSNVDLRSVHLARQDYARRTEEYKPGDVLQATKVGSWIAGISFALFWLSFLFNNEFGPFKTLCLLGILTGLAILIYSFNAPRTHEKEITESLDNYNRAEISAQEKLSSCAIGIRQGVEAAKAQALAALAGREAALRTRYTLEISGATLAFRRVW